MSGLEGHEQGAREAAAQHGGRSSPLAGHPAPLALSFVPRPVAAPTPHQSPRTQANGPTVLLQRPPRPVRTTSELDSEGPDDLGADKGH